LFEMERFFSRLAKLAGVVMACFCCGKARPECFVASFVGLSMRFVNHKNSAWCQEQFCFGLRPMDTFSLQRFDDDAPPCTAKSWGSTRSLAESQPILPITMACRNVGSCAAVDVPEGSRPCGPQRHGSVLRTPQIQPIL